MNNEINKRRNTPTGISPIQENVPTKVSGIESAPSVRFSVFARAITDAGKCLGLNVPSFRSPPHDGRLDRTLRRHTSGSIVAVRVKDRPFGAVIADLVEGVIVCNRLTQREAGDVRNVLWDAAIRVEQKSHSTSTRRPTALIHRSSHADRTAAA
jgi:hypothetical protein